MDDMKDGRPSDQWVRLSAEIRAKREEVRRKSVTEKPGRQDVTIKLDASASAFGMSPDLGKM